MLRYLFIILPLCGIVLLSQGAYIHTKALLAQFLLKEAWAETTLGKKEVRPWPWADTWPVSRLTVPRLGISRIVLAGTSGSSLAFGPGHFFDSSLPGQPGNIIIAGHRDTHFKFLQSLVLDDIITLEDAAGIHHYYQVSDIQVVHEDDYSSVYSGEEHSLTLITCYPFDAVNPGGPLRYVIAADSIKPNQPVFI